MDSLKNKVPLYVIKTHGEFDHRKEEGSIILVDKKDVAQDIKDGLCRMATHEEFVAWASRKSEEDLEARLSIFDDSIKKNYIDLGECEHGWYFGVWANGSDAIVTSGRKFYRNTQRITRKVETGTNEIPFKYDDNVGEIARRWSPSSLKEYLRGRRVEKRQLYEAVMERLNYFLDYSIEPLTYQVLASWTMATYFYPMFYWFPNLLMNGPTGSGKSKAAYIIQNMGFGGYDFGASAGLSKAQMYRTLGGNRGTIVIDEFERNDTSDSYKMACQVLNAGTNRDAFVIRPDEENHWAPKKFPIYSPKIACNITGLNPTTLSRFIVAHHQRTANEKSKRKPYRVNETQKLWAISDDLHILALDNWREVKTAYDSLEVNLWGRDEDNWLPVLAIAKWIGDDVLKDCLAFAEGARGLEIETGSIEADFFLTLVDCIPDEKKAYTAKEIAGKTADVLASLNLKAPSIWVGNMMKRYKFFPKHRAGGQTFIISRSDIRKIIELYNWGSMSSDSSLSSFPSDSSDSSALKSEDPEDYEDPEDFSRGEGSSLKPNCEKLKTPSDGLCELCGARSWREFSIEGRIACRGCYDEYQPEGDAL